MQEEIQVYRRFVKVRRDRAFWYGALKRNGKPDQIYLGPADGLRVAPGSEHKRQWKPVFVGEAARQGMR